MIPRTDAKPKIVLSFVLAIVAVSASAQLHSPERKQLEQTILHHDSLFWLAYNKCDIEGMAAYLTDDLEFYHDKGGLTTTRQKLMENTRTGMCGNTDYRLRREAIAETLEVFPLDGYGAILSGQHVFYVTEKGKPERLDGLAKFTHVWRNRDGAWKMHRILSYDHGPAVYRNLRTEVSQPRKILKEYVGTYESPKKMNFVVSLENNRLVLHTATFRTTLYASAPDIFFVKERDLQLHFAKQKDGGVTATVQENGVAVDELTKVR